MKGGRVPAAVSHPHPQPQPIPSICLTLQSPPWAVGLPLPCISLCWLGDLSPALSPASFSPGAPALFSRPASSSSALLAVPCQTLKAPSPMGVRRSDSLLHSLSWASARGYNNDCVWSQRASVEPGSNVAIGPNLWASWPFSWVKRLTPTHPLSRKSLCAQPLSQEGLERWSP